MDLTANVYRIKTRPFNSHTSARVSPTTPTRNSSFTHISYPIMFTTTLFTYVLLAIGAAAFPSSAERHAARVVERHQSAPRRTVEASSRHASGDASVSSNWAGAVLSADKASADTGSFLHGTPGITSHQGTYKSVTGTFTVPTPKLSSEGGQQAQAASVWVGIDGNTCQTALLQTGVDLNVDANGEVSYDGARSPAHPVAASAHRLFHSLVRVDPGGRDRLRGHQL